MERRKFLAATASGLTAGLAGCTGASSRVSDLVEERAEPTGSDLDVDISASGPGITITPSGALPEKAVLRQDGEDVLSVEMTGVDRDVYEEIIRYERAKDPEKRLFEPGTVELVFVDSDGTEMKTKEWEFQPHPVVGGFTIATTSEYDPTDALMETTPVFRLRNIGTGPTCLSAIEVKNPRTAVSLAGSEEQATSPMLRTGTFAIDDPEISIHRTPHRMTGLLPVERDFYLAFNDLFTATVPNADLETAAPPEQITQTFDVAVHTVYGESYTTTIDVAMVGGVENAESEESSWTHRYRTVRLESVSYESR
jgi:hypothetical protein